MKIVGTDLRTVADPEKKLRGVKILGFIWFLKSTKKRKNIKENYFLVFSCLIKII